MPAETAPDSVTGEVELGPADHFHASYWGQSTAFRVCIWLIVVALAVLLALQLQADEPDYEWSIFIALVLAGMCALPLYVHWRMRPDQLRMVYTIDREKIVIADRTGTALTLPWSQIAGCREYKSGFRITIPPGHRWLVKRAFNEPALAHFRAIARASLGERARLS